MFEVWTCLLELCASTMVDTPLVANVVLLVYLLCRGKYFIQYWFRPYKKYLSSLHAISSILLPAKRKFNEHLKIIRTLLEVCMHIEAMCIHGIAKATWDSQSTTRIRNCKMHKQLIIYKSHSIHTFDTHQWEPIVASMIDGIIHVANRKRTVKCEKL